MRYNPPATFDVEVTKNSFMLLARDIGDGHVAHWQRYEDVDEGPYRREDVHGWFSTHRNVSFNGLGFDQAMIAAYVAGWDNATLWKLCCWLIKTPMVEWRWREHCGLEWPDTRWQHLDVMPIAPGQLSLKMYGARLDCALLQDLPHTPGRPLSRREMVEQYHYCVNDLRVTEMLYRDLLGEIELRERMVEQYGNPDLTSRSDSQIASRVLKAQLREKGRTDLYPVEPVPEWCYRQPSWVKHTSEAMIALTTDLATTPMELSAKLQPKHKKGIERTLEIAGKKYRFAMGGLHSKEKKLTLVPRTGETLMMADIASMYPNVMLTNGFAPSYLRDDLLPMFQSIVAERLDAKRKKDKVTADSLKIMVNSTYGLMGSRYSFLHAPDMVAQVTITGQLGLLMLVEWLESDPDIEVVSANTDGVVYLTTNPQRARDICDLWCVKSGLELEYDELAGLYARDVNNYFCVFKADDSVKRKGVFKPGPDIWKNPANRVIQTAVIEKRLRGMPIDETIRRCREIKDFVAMRKVNGGAMWKGRKVGKSVRWYRGTAGSEITYAINGNLVPLTAFAVLANDLPRTFPDDIDYDWYITEAEKLDAALGEDER